MNSYSGDEIFAAIERAAAERPNDPALYLVRDTSGSTDRVSNADVLRLARCGAAFFQARGLRPGTRVLLNLPTGEGYLAAMLGALHAGMIPASIAPLAFRRGAAALAEWRNLLDILRPALVVSAEGVADDSVAVAQPLAILAADPKAARDRVAGNAMGCIQFSSGSTGTPRALVLQMSAIVFNLETMIGGIPLRKDDHIVSWLPMYHDMGLFGTLLIALHHGTRLTLMDTSLFVKRPLLWFKVLEQAGGSVTVAPPSAYRTVMDLLRRRPLERVDLSSCTRFVCGAELVTPRLVRSYGEVLVPLGAPPNGLKPVYGLSEITLAATMPPAERGPRVDWIDGKAFQDTGWAKPSEEGEPWAVGWVSVGHVLNGQGLRVVSEEGRDLPDRRVGRVLVSSPSLYTAEIYGDDVILRQGEWLDTGDRAYRVDEDLFITGRERDVIIRGGRNLSPERLEELAAHVEGVSGAAAFGVRDQARDTERVVVVAEVHRHLLRDVTRSDLLRLAIRTELASAGYDVDDVVLTERGSLPRTTSGKVRRKASRVLYLGKTLPTLLPR